MSNLLREHAEQQFAEELHVLAETDQRPRPPNWHLSPWAVATYLLGGTLPNDRLVEVVEVKDHPWFVGTQFHPEFKSRPTKPHPLFRDFVAAALNYGQTR